MTLIVSCHRIANANPGEDNVLKMACDLTIVVTCMCELAFHWDVSQLQATDELCDAAADYSPYEWRFLVILAAIVLTCLATVFFKFCRLRFAFDIAPSRLPCIRIAVRMLAGVPHSEVVRADLQATRHAMLRYTMLGVASDEDACLLGGPLREDSAERGLLI